VIGVSNESLPAISDFAADQGITFPILHDTEGVYGLYNLPGAASPYPRDFILDENGVVRMAKTEYEPGVMIAIIETLLDVSTVDLESNSHQHPDQQALIKVYPNPFNPETKINILIREEGRVSLELFDVRGRHLQAILSDRTLSSGQHEFDFRSENLGSGIYFLVMETQQDRYIQKIVKLR
jgi:hypothetical protein